MLDEKLIETFNDESEMAENSAVWESHANNIIVGIEANDDVKPVRAIWEMVQNARDEHGSESPAEIVFTRKHETFVFQHNGLPFTKTALYSLIIQTSSKNQNDSEKVGKYGTGFLTTHKLGREFHLSGSLRMKRDADYFYNFEDFVIDRRSEDKTVLGKCIQELVKETKSWNQHIDKISTTPSKYTIFTYYYNNDQEKSNAKEAMRDAPALAQYVLALNKGIGSIEFTDEVLGDKMKFIRRGEATNEENGDYSLRSCEIITETDGVEDSVPKTVFLLESLKERTKKGEPKVTIILPIMATDNGYDAFLFEESVPRLFLSLPLLGTSDCGALNYIIHSPEFVCDNDNRDNIRFSGNSQETENKAQVNRELIELAHKILLQFLGNNIEKIRNRKYLSIVRFRLLNANEKTKEYYKTLQNRWVSQMKFLKLVESDGLLQPQEIKVLDEELMSACSSNLSLLDAIYYMFEKTGEKAPVRPMKCDMLYWSRVINDWYEDKERDCFLTISHIADIIASLTFNEGDLQQLYVIEKYIADNNNNKLFESKEILPNIDLKLCKREGMLDAVSFNVTIMSILRALCPETVSLIAHPCFSKLVKLDVYNNDSMKASLSNSINTLVDLQKPGDVQKDKGEGSFSRDKYERCFFPESIVRAILKLYNMIVDKNSDSVESKALLSFCDFYNFHESITDTIEKNLFDSRTCFYALLKDSLFKFTCMNDKDKEEKREWLYSLLNATQYNSETRKRLIDYEICPDQLGDFHYAETLKREGPDMKSELKDIFDIVIRHTSEKDKSDSILHSLIRSENNPMIAETSIMTGLELALELEKIVRDEYHYDLKDKEYAKYFVDIINKLSNQDDEAIEWKNLFKDIDSNKGSLLLSAIVSERKKNHIFNFIKADEDKLEVMSNVINDPNLMEIIRLGKEQIKQQLVEQNEFNFKLKLGKYVENFLRAELSSFLGVNFDLNIPSLVKDEQGGQDIVIRLGEKVVYYIEVKSRWGTDKSVLMSMRQHKNSIEHAGNYALCVVDMSNYILEPTDDARDLHIYPDNISEIKDKISVLEGIGALNKEIDEACTAQKDKVYVESGYMVHITQDVIRNNSVKFSDFEKHLVTYIKSLT